MDKKRPKSHLAFWDVFVLPKSKDYSTALAAFSAAFRPQVAAMA